MFLLHWYWHVLCRFYYGAYCVILLLLFRIQISTECHSVMLENNKPNTPNLNLNLPESVNECKRNIKLYLLMQPCYVNLREFELFCQTVVSRIHTGVLHLSSATPNRVSYRASLPHSETHTYEAGHVTLTFRSTGISFQILQHQVITYIILCQELCEH